MRRGDPFPMLLSRTLVELEANSSSHCHRREQNEVRYQRNLLKPLSLRGTERSGVTKQSFLCFPPFPTILLTPFKRSNVSTFQERFIQRPILPRAPLPRKILLHPPPLQTPPAPFVPVNFQGSPYRGCQGTVGWLLK